MLRMLHEEEWRVVEVGFSRGGPEPFMIHLESINAPEGSGFNLAPRTLVLVRSPGMASRK